MIASLSGILAAKHEKFIVVETAGIGYKVYISAETLRALPHEGDAVKLSTVMHVREDAMELYGFASEPERDLFALLNTISGIGPKAAMSILGAATIQKLLEAIAHGDESVLTTVSGIGKKLAAKVILELKDKVRDAIRYEGKPSAALGDVEVFDALRALGYGERQIQEALRSIPAEVVKMEERIRAALKLLGR